MDIHPTGDGIKKRKNALSSCNAFFLSDQNPPSLHRDLILIVCGLDVSGGLKYLLFNKIVFYAD